MKKVCASNKGITLLTLTITIVIMLILSFTISINVSTYVERRQKTNLETDIIRLQEEIAHYYVENKSLPIINKYTNTDMLSKNKNDDENYYVIDMSKMAGLDLNYGKDYGKITDYTVEINDLLDIYIINEQSHAIYYPRGVLYGKNTYYTINNEDSTKIEDMPVTSIEIIGENITQIGEIVELNVNIVPTFALNTGVKWVSSDEAIATVDETGIVTAKKAGTVIITATSNDNEEIVDTHELTIEQNSARYVLVEVYDHLGYDGASISELEIYDNENNKINYNVIVKEAYDSVTQGLPNYWEDENNWNYTNLYDGYVSYTNTLEGEQNSTLFINSSEAQTGNYARFIVDLGEEKNITDIVVYIGDSDAAAIDGIGGRTPLLISAYKINTYFAHEENNTYSTYYNNVAQRKDDGLKLLGILESEEKVTTTTAYSLMK